MRPLFPYAGSSKKVAPLIASIIYHEYPDLNNMTYCEPMIGSGAVFFELCPPKAIIGDIEPLTVNLYKVVRDDPYRLCEELRAYPPRRDLFMEFQERIYHMEDGVQKAATWYFLLVLCYNGVVKFHGYCFPNLSFGDRHLTWIQRLSGRERSIHAASKVLQGVTIHCRSFRKIPLIPRQITFFDPPWFDSAEDYGVPFFEHQQLAKFLGYFDPMVDKWLLTINDCEKAQRIYMPLAKWYLQLSPFYSVAPVASTRKKNPELLLANFKPRMFGG